MFASDDVAPSTFALFEQMEDSVAAYRRDGTVVYLNGATQRLFGRRADQMVGRVLWELFPDAVDNPFHRCFDRVASTGRPEALLHHYGPFDRWFDNWFYVTGDLVWVLARDVTELRGAQRRRDEAQRRLELLSDVSRAFAQAGHDVAATCESVARLVAEALGDHCVVRMLSPDRKLLHVLGFHDLGTPFGEAINRIAPQPADEGLSGRAMATLAPQLIASVNVETVANDLSRPDHRELVRTAKPLSLMVVPIVIDGAAAGVISTARFLNRAAFTEDDLRLLSDVADRAALFIANAQSYERAEQASRRKDEFLALLGHELRNPLAPILTALQLMRMRDEGAVPRERDVIERHVRHMVELVDDLLDVARITGGKLQLRRERVLLADVVAGALEMASPLIEARSHHLTITLPPDPVVMFADPTRLAQVFSNLLTNAAKYTEPGGHIAVEGTVQEETVRVTVRDDGIGVPSDMQAKIFEPFTQASRVGHAGPGGLGLGLPLVRSLVDLHGGRVTLISGGTGRGSAFTVELPSASASVIGARSGAEGDPARTAYRRRVLVVDDNEDAADTLAEALTLLGHEVTVAYDGPSALERARTFVPDVAVLDIGLPVMDGHELARRLVEERGSAPPLRLIAVTGYGQDGDRERSRAAGFAVHLTKPVDLNGLSQQIEAL